MVPKRDLIVIIEGPNLNKIENRSSIYKSNHKLSVILNLIKETFDIEYFQSNIEGEIINKIQSLIDSDAIGLIINPAAYTHYSVAISDALELLNIKKVEVHLTNLYKREDFRHISVTAKNCDIVISGAKNYGYFLASEYIKNSIK